MIQYYTAELPLIQYYPVLLNNIQNVIEYWKTKYKVHSVSVRTAIESKDAGKKIKHPYIL